MPVRILHIVGDSKFGGASLGILRLASFWQSLGWRVEVLSTDTDFQREALARSVPVVPLDAIWRSIRIFRDLKGLWRLTRFLRRERYDIIHTHTTKAGFVGRLAGLFARVPVVVHTAHGFAFHERSPWWKIAFYVTLERIASVGCDRVIAVSGFHKKWGERLGIAESSKILAIPNGIPECPPEPAAASEAADFRQSLGLRPDELFLFTPGRLAAEKGLEDLIDALVQVKSSSMRFRCLIAGDGPIRGELEQRVADRGLSGEVVFLGFRSDVPHIMQAADLMVFPSWREGLSIALLESMCAGRAIVSTSIGSTIEATADGRAALLVDPGDIPSLAEAIVKLGRDPALRDQLGAAARELFLKRYTLVRMLDDYHQVYRELLKEKNFAQSFSTLLPSPDR